MFHGARILVAPLDWGLGHSTRCIPIIRRLLHRGATPIIGADAGPLALLTKEFPDLEHVRIPGVHVRYSRGNSQLWSMARQFPEMVRIVRSERAAFDRIRVERQLDAVISDQRFGLRSPDVPSVLITHQVFPFTPIAQGALRRVNLHHMARFDRCWIMDEPDEPGLAGELSHGRTLPSNARYIGTISRMAPGSGSSTPQRYRIVAVISGPEPQRSMLDAALTEQLQCIPGHHLLVRGLPKENTAQRYGRLTCIPHTNGDELSSFLTNAELVVSRSGYTTLMDLDALGKSALVVPTPGQAEQEYLGRLHARTGRFLVQPQENLNVAAALTSIRNCSVPAPTTGNAHLERALDELAALLR